MTTTLLITILILGKPHELTRDMPNLDICLSAMAQLEHFDSVVELQCRQE
jgi:hypothetical protein